MEDIISPREHEAYEQIKAEFVIQLFSHEEKGHRKPSQFLRHAKGLSPDVPDDFLRTIRARRLPPHVQAILAGQTEGSLDSASHLTDRICEITPLHTAASISPSTPDSTAGPLERTDELWRQVALLRASRTQPLAVQRPQPFAIHR